MNAPILRPQRPAPRVHRFFGRFHRFGLPILAVLVLAALAPSARCQDVVTSRDAIEVQNARAKIMKARKKVHPNQYYKKFDLSGLPEYKPEHKVYGAIRIWGLNYITDSNLGDYWSDGFKGYHPDATIEWHTPTALVFNAGLITGVADIGASRPIMFDEILTFERTFGYAPLELSMVTGSYNVQGWAPEITIFVNKENPIDKLTFKQLDGIMGAERDGGYVGLDWHPEFARGPEGNIRTWGQLGLTGEWADHAINFYGGNHRRHEQFVIEKKVFHGNKWNERMHEYSNYVRPDGTMSIALVQQIEDIEKDKFGIGYNSMAQITPKIKPLAIAEKDGGPYVLPTLDTIHDRTYPLISEEFFYINRRPGQPVDANVKEFLRYALGRQGQDAVMRDGRFLPLTAEVSRAQLAKLE